MKVEKGGQTMSQLKDVGCYHYSPWRFLGRKERLR